MNTSFLTNPHLLGLSRNWGWMLLWGLVLIALGCVAISAATLTTILSVIFLGVIIFIAGVVLLIDSFKSWWGRWGGFFLHLIVSLLYLAVGAMLIQNPISGSVSLTLLLGAFFLVIGVFRIIYSLSFLLPQWGLTLLSGIISLTLGILILSNWPVSGLFVIGLFIGIDLLVAGFTYVIFALTIRNA